MKLLESTSCILSFIYWLFDYPTFLFWTLSSSPIYYRIPQVLLDNSRIFGLSLSRWKNKTFLVPMLLFSSNLVGSSPILSPWLILQQRDFVYSVLSPDLTSVPSVHPHPFHPPTEDSKTEPVDLPTVPVSSFLSKLYPLLIEMKNKHLS